MGYLRENWRLQGVFIKFLGFGLRYGLGCGGLGSRVWAGLMGQVIPGQTGFVVLVAASRYWDRDSARSESWTKGGTGSGLREGWG